MKNKSLEEYLLSDLNAAYAATKEDKNTDWDIGAEIEHYLDKESSLINIVVAFFEKCELFELKLRMAPVILSNIEHKAAYDISVESGRSPQWLYDSYHSVREMVRKGIISI